MANMVLLDYDRLDYKKLPFGKTMGQYRDIGWPVLAYRITMPIPGMLQDQVNPIHRLVVKLIQAHWKPEEQFEEIGGARVGVEKTTGLPWDIVRCTLLRLQDRGIIDDYYELTPMGKELLAPEPGEDGQEKEDEERIATALVFRELIGGTVLPFVQVVSNENPLRKHVKASDEKVKSLQAGKEFRNADITVQEVLSAYRRWRRMAKAYGDEDCEFPSEHRIKIVGEPEPYYLKCPMAILSRDGDFAVADPFGYGLSSVLESVLRKWLAAKGRHDEKFEDWLLEWNESTAVKEDHSDVKHVKEPFENDHCLEQYPRLVNSLKKGESRQFMPIAQIYASIEWAFFYYSAKFESKEILEWLDVATEIQFVQKMADLAKRRGLVLDRKSDGRLQTFEFKALTPKRRADYVNSSPELISVFMILLLQMDKGFCDGKIKNLIQTHKEILLDLLEVKRKHDPEVHGKNNEGRGAKEYAGEFQLMQEIIRTLLPDVPLSKDDQALAMKVAYADQRQAAMARLLRCFTFSIWTDMDQNLKNYLISTERYRQFEFANGGRDVMPMVREGYSALQAAFRVCLRRGGGTKVLESRYKIEARRRAKNLGLKYPDVLDSVREGMITATLDGNDQTLGACMVAFLLVMGDDVLIDIASTAPDLLKQVAKVVALRQHGNVAVPMDDKDQVNVFCKSVYEVTKVLLEV